MKRAALIVLWICVIAGGAFLRFEDLAVRPFHADEATGARITARRMETGGRQFDPKHFHGPLLADLAVPLCRLRGETRWQDLSKATLRLLPAIAGSLLVVLPLLWRRRLGDAPMWLAAALLATSPLLVYYSRMFIHESLIGLFGMLAVMTLLSYPKYGIPGIFIGLMFATKESFVISLIAWAGAGVGVAAWNYRSLRRDQVVAAWWKYHFHFLASLLTAVLVSGFFYTDGFRQPDGWADAMKTFFIYKTGEGHDKPFLYYLQLLLLPQKSAGVWWFGTPVGLLAVLALAGSFGRRLTDPRLRPTVQFLALAAAAQFIGYGLIAYKTPWLMVLPWAHVCLLAGFALAGVSRLRLPLQSALAVLAGACLVTQIRQTRLATGRYASDARNPFAYVPTRPDLETLEPWLAQLRKVAPGGTLEPVAVSGADYWPLPWYLRSFDQIGYWPQPPPDLDRMPLVFALPDTAEAVTTALAKSHVALPRGLRAGVPVWLFVRNDIWRCWMPPPPR